MGWLMEWWDKLIQGAVWETIASQFAWVDAVTLAVVLLGLIYGAKNGLLRTMAVFLEAVVVVVAVKIIYKRMLVVLAPSLKFLPEETLACILFFLTAGFFGFLMMLADKELQKLLHTQLVAPIRIPGGMMMGVILLLLLWSLVVQALVLFPLPSLRRTFESGHSLTGFYIRGFVPRVFRVMTFPFPDLQKGKY